MMPSPLVAQNVDPLGHDILKPIRARLNGAVAVFPFHVFVFPFFAVSSYFCSDSRTLLVVRLFFVRLASFLARLLSTR